MNRTRQFFNPVMSICSCLGIIQLSISLRIVIVIAHENILDNTLGHRIRKERIPCGNF